MNNIIQVDKHILIRFLGLAAAYGMLTDEIRNMEDENPDTMNELLLKFIERVCRVYPSSEDFAIDLLRGTLACEGIVSVAAPGPSEN